MALVGETGKALEVIVGQVQEINVNVAAIVEGSREQATGLREINIAVNTMDQGTQQNAALVEESTAASHTLAGEAEELFALVGQFKVDEDQKPIAVRRVDRTSSPAPSPARQMVRKVARAFGGNAAAKESWEEF